MIPNKNTAAPVSRAWVEISLNNIGGNYRQIKQTVKPADVMVVLKANAYGLGILPIASYLHHIGVKRIGLAEARESITLTKLKNLDCQILGALLPEEIQMRKFGKKYINISAATIQRSKRIKACLKVLELFFFSVLSSAESGNIAFPIGYVRKKIVLAIIAAIA